jgi:transglutaminase-like putative cysteine protease
MLYGKNFRTAIAGISVLGLSSFGFSLDTGKSADYDFEYKVVVTPEKGEKEVSVWVPYPAENEVQSVSEFSSNSRWPMKISFEPKYGNKIIYVKVTNPGPKEEISFKYRIRRFESKGYGLKNTSAKPDQDPQKFLGADRLVPNSPEITDMAASATKGKTNQSEKIRAMYDDVVAKMKYDKSGEGWGKGDAIWACDAKRGNCTDFHSLFIGMARSQKIPALFEIGVPLPPDLKEGTVPGYHCWAAAYEPTKGWIPVDASEAKKSGKIEYFFGTLCENRIHFTTGRDLVLNPPQKGDPLNYFIFPYAEVEGKKFAGIKSEFNFKRLAQVQLSKNEAP